MTGSVPCLILLLTGPSREFETNGKAFDLVEAA
jgi:hypothetical protein